MDISLSCVDDHIFLNFLPSPEECRRKTYPAMDSPVYGEDDGANFVSVEDCIHNACNHCTNRIFCCYHFVHKATAVSKVLVSTAETSVDHLFDYLHKEIVINWNLEYE